MAKDKAVTTPDQRLRAGIAAYQAEPPTDGEIELGLLGDASGLADDTDWGALYPDESS
jgi:hypothetical protein